MRVSAINLHILAFTLDTEGHNSARVLARCGLPGVAGIPARDWVPVELFETMIEATLAETGDAFFGLVAGRSLAQMRYGVMPSLVLHMPNVRQCLADITRFSALVVERCEFVLSESGSRACLAIEPVVQRPAASRYRAEAICAGLVQMLRVAAGAKGEIRSVDLPFDAPSSLDRHVAALGAGLRFGADRCEIHFDAALLDVPMATHDPALYLAARTRAEAALSARGQGPDLVRRVRERLLASLPHGASAAECAQAFAMSERSLRRQLAALGVSFADLCQQSQQMMAERLLAERERSIKEVADQLGFASVSSFHRAFRRWTDMTPWEWRGNHL